MRLTLLGIGMGIPVSLALTRVLVSMIFGVRPRDPAGIAAVSMLLAGVAVSAAYLPSLRAAEVSPYESLKN